MQYNKTHAVTLVAAAALAACRLIGRDGGYADSSGGLHDCQGVSETEAAEGDAVSVVTGYSYPVTCGEDIALGDYIKPGTAGVAMIGTADDHCGRALGAGVEDGLVEMQIVMHIHPAVPD
ncbi:MAG: DUF2190 domain-containing protein [Ramlibacter sp.]|nr:DUF2190 domain-containing protein [Ramlibacter sp.]